MRTPEKCLMPPFLVAKASGLSYSLAAVSEKKPEVRFSRSVE